MTNWIHICTDEPIPLPLPTTHPERCQAPRLGYLAAHADAKHRMQRGEQQTFCSACERWQWGGQRCPAYARDEAYEAAADQAARKRR